MQERKTFPIEFGVKIDTFPMKFGGKIDTFPILCREKGGEMAGCLPGSIPIVNRHDAALLGSNLPARSAFFTQTPQEFFFTQAQLFFTIDASRFFTRAKRAIT